MLQRNGQCPHMVVMTMADHDGLEVLLLDVMEEWEAGPAFAFGMNASIEENRMSFEVDEPGTRPDVGIRIQVDYAHRISGTGV